VQEAIKRQKGSDKRLGTGCCPNLSSTCDERKKVSENRSFPDSPVIFVATNGENTVLLPKSFIKHLAACSNAL